MKERMHIFGYVVVTDLREEKRGRSVKYQIQEGGGISCETGERKRKKCSILDLS